MIDTLLAQRDGLDVPGTLARYGVERGAYALLTLHRPSNVDTPESLGETLAALRALHDAARASSLGAAFRMLFPIHPRTKNNLRAFDLESAAAGMVGLELLPPIPYPDFLALMSAAGLVVTDSGGIQEETTVLGVPCLTMRENTERPITIDEGTNTLVGRDADLLVWHGLDALTGDRPTPARPHLWDGHAAERIVRVLFGG